MYDETDASMALSLFSDANSDKQNGDESIAMVLHVDLADRKSRRVVECQTPITQYILRMGESFSWKSWLRYSLVYLLAMEMFPS